MILVDTSAWVEFLRGTDSWACNEVERLLAGGAAITDPVSMEVLAGARDDAHLRSLRGLLGRTEVIPCRPAHFDAAATLYRACRRNGETVRRLIDCLIGAVALGAGASILHADSDFDVLARHTPLQVHRGPSER